jgi:hypothetical protein
MPRPGRFTPGKTRYPLYRRLGGPQDRSGQMWKISPPQDSIPGQFINLHWAEEAHWHRPCITDQKNISWLYPHKNGPGYCIPHHRQKKLQPTFLQWQSQHGRQIKTNTFVYPSNTSQRTISFRHNKHPQRGHHISRPKTYITNEVYTLHGPSQSIINQPNCTYLLFKLPVLQTTSVRQHIKIYWVLSHLIFHPFITNFTNYVQYCKPHGILFGT